MKKNDKNQNGLTLLKAMELVMMTRPNEIIKSSYELENCYVFSTQPIKHDETKHGRCMKAPIAVSKKDCSIFTFNPLDYDADVIKKSVKNTLKNY